jgi:hypothetical protein
LVEIEDRTPEWRLKKVKELARPTGLRSTSGPADGDKKGGHVTRAWLESTKLEMPAGPGGGLRRVPLTGYRQADDVIRF